MPTLVELMQKYAAKHNARAAKMLDIAAKDYLRDRSSRPLEERIERAAIQEYDGEMSRREADWRNGLENER